MDFIQYIGLTLGIAVVLIILIFAFSGPSASKATNRRLVSVRDRHLVGASNIEARMKSIVSTTFNPASQKGGSILPSPALIKLRLTQTGKDWTLKQYLLASLGLTIGVGLTALVQGAPPLLSVLAGALAGLGLPHFAVGYLIKKRSAGFNTKFPDALELMVRGLRSGLPISETLGIVGAEIDGSLGDEFQAVSDKMKIGRSMEDALQDTADRIGTPEVFLHHAGHSAGNGRQPRRNPLQPGRGAAQARSNEAENQRHVFGIKGIGLHHRFSAVYRLRADLYDQPRLHGQILR
jgi:tight adherence protein B